MYHFKGSKSWTVPDLVQCKFHTAKSCQSCIDGYEALYGKDTCQGDCVWDDQKNICVTKEFKGGILKSYDSRVIFSCIK